MEGFCSQFPEHMNYKLNTTAETVSSSTERNEESGVNSTNGGPSVISTTLIVTVVVLVCAVGGCLILTKVVKRRKKRQKTPEYYDVCVPKAENVSVHSYAEFRGTLCLSSFLRRCRFRQ